MYVCECVRIFKCMYVCVCVCICMYVYMYTYVCICICVCIYVYIFLSCFPFSYKLERVRSEAIFKPEIQYITLSLSV